MSPKKSSARKGAATKSSAKKTARKSASKSPMQKIERAVGPNTEGLADQARAAHDLPREVPYRTPARSTPAAPTAPMNTPPAPTTTTPAVDAGQKE